MEWLGGWCLDEFNVFVGPHSSRLLGGRSQSNTSSPRYVDRVDGSLWLGGLSTVLSVISPGIRPPSCAVPTHLSLKLATKGVIQSGEVHGQG